MIGLTRDGGLRKVAKMQILGTGLFCNRGTVLCTREEDVKAEAKTVTPIRWTLYMH